mmetsp:Transcript_35277/g.97584  ORF Transcript_35277/g.97584 Transcript_35277/m.97584 type:complete len:212 (-) Transcript_35277:352-987(-)
MTTSTQSSTTFRLGAMCPHKCALSGIAPTRRASTWISSLIGTMTSQRLLLLSTTMGSPGTIPQTRWRPCCQWTRCASSTASSSCQDIAWRTCRAISCFGHGHNCSATSIQSPFGTHSHAVPNSQFCAMLSRSGRKASGRDSAALRMNTTGQTSRVTSSFPRSAWQMVLALCWNGCGSQFLQPCRCCSRASHKCLTSTISALPLACSLRSPG